MWTWETMGLTSEWVTTTTGLARKWNARHASPRPAPVTLSTTVVSDFSLGHYFRGLLSESVNVLVSCYIMRATKPIFLRLRS